MPSKPDLSKFSVFELREIVVDAEKTIQRKLSEELKKAKQAAEEAAKKHGFSLSELFGQTVAKTGTTQSSKPKNPPKHKNPNDPDQTWSGRGRQPEWFKDALGKGKSPEDMLI